MSKLDEIKGFIKELSGIDEINTESDIYSLGITGDDFHEMIAEYSKNYKVDMSEYLWYFHADEEGLSFGKLFFKPPYSRVERVPVTPKILAEFAETRKWTYKYTGHELPNKRIDLIINQIIVIVFVLIALTVWILY